MIGEAPLNKLHANPILMAVSNLSPVNHELVIIVSRIVELEDRFHEMYDEFACRTGFLIILIHLERI